VCCIDPLFLEELDFSVVRLVLKLECADDISVTLLVHDAFGDSSALVDVCIVGS
jgi:hypothetical protein